MNTASARERIHEVIRTDVVTSSEADFLATHVALKNIKVIKSGEKETGDRYKIDTEENIYKKYIINKENKHQLIIVRGPSGAGKSHLIRWFAARINQSNLENEEILFIRRSDNNLKGTIKQLLGLDAVSNIPNKDIIERLLRATVIVDDNKFRDMIYQNFIVELKNDDNTEYLSSVTKKNLEALLQNDMFQERIKQIGGPIDRIYAKVSSKDSVGYKDVVALFETDDFLVDIDFCRELEKKGADRKAIKIANKIPIEKELAADIAKYLNTFVDQVIQSCAGIEPGDFEQIFKDIRHELKLARKNLILLIEDITAFTGINKALLNVLTTEHTGMYESQELCRISSVVGTTDAYYDEFRDNYKDRITNQFVISDNVFGNNQEDLFEFVARYINAMSLPQSALENWVKEGCVLSEYPVSLDNFDERWDFFEITNDKKISFYPFSKNAVINLYAALPLKTPRSFLREIIEKVINDILYNEKNFPGFQCTYMPIWNPINHGHVLANEISDEADFNRVEKFIRVWGNASLFRTEKNGIEYLSGIQVSIFEDFNMPVVGGIKTTGKESLPANGDNKANANFQDTTQKKVNLGIDKTKIKMEISAEDKQFQEGRKSIEVWLAGGSYSSFRKVRDDICDYLVTAINWQAEGVSYDAVMRVIRSRNLIGFERQKRASNENLVNLSANRETQEIVEAFLAWRILGNCKWRFTGAVYMQYRVTLWTQKIKDELIKSIIEVDGKELNYFRCACTAEIYRLILLGLNGGSTLNCITRDLIIGNNLKKIDDNSHVKQWNDLVSVITNNKQDDENKTLVRQYYNTFQGKIAKTHSAQIFLNDEKFQNGLNAVIKSNLQLDKDYLNIVDNIAARNEPREYLSKILLRLNTVIIEEKAKAQNIINRIQMYLECEDDYDYEIKEICEEISVFYKSLAKNQVNYVPKNGMISNVKQKCKEIETAIKTAKKACEVEDTTECLLLFSHDPIRKMEWLCELLDEVEKDANNLKNDIERKREKLTTNSSEAMSPEMISQLVNKKEGYKKICERLEGKQC